jgi:hypothetical protein
VWHYGAVSDGLRYDDQPLTLRHVAVTGNFFEVLGTRPFLSLLRPDDAAAGAAPRGDDASPRRAHRYGVAATKTPCGRRSLPRRWRSRS